jgi:hypothetical protein
LHLSFCPILQYSKSAFSKQSDADEQPTSKSYLLDCALKPMEALGRFPSEPYKKLGPQFVQYFRAFQNDTDRDDKCRAESTNEKAVAASL